MAVRTPVLVHADSAVNGRALPAEQWAGFWLRDAAELVAARSAAARRSGSARGARRAGRGYVEREFSMDAYERRLRRCCRHDGASGANPRSCNNAVTSGRCRLATPQASRALDDESPMVMQKRYTQLDSGIARQGGRGNGPRGGNATTRDARESRNRRDAR